MSLNLTNNLETRTLRLENLDFLRGVFIILAINQHFTYYLNMWYVEYFRDSIALGSTYKVHFPMIGQTIATDVYNHFLGIIFTPWVSQIYLTMAAFNLAQRDQNDFAKVLNGKLKVMGMLFLFFIAENFMVAPNFGEAISFYPIMLWMIILSIIAIIYNYLGIGGVLGLALFSSIRFVLPVEQLSDFFQGFVRENLHIGFEYDARLEYFIHSGCLGFIMGYFHYQKQNYFHKKDLIFIILGALLIIPYYIWGDKFFIDVEDALKTEHDLARTFTGTFYILGIQAIVISLFLWAEKKGLKLKVPIVSWVGKNSILVFALHRILFVRILAPIGIFLGSLFGFTLGASIGEIHIYVIITIIISYIVRNSRILEIILQKKG